MATLCRQRTEGGALAFLFIFAAAIGAMVWGPPGGVIGLLLATVIAIAPTLTHPKAKRSSRDPNEKVARNKYRGGSQ